MNDNNQPISPDRIMQLIWGYAPPLILEAAISLHIFDTLEAGPMSIPQVAAATGASERGLRCLMNALVSLDFLSKRDGRYVLTPESAAFLVSSKDSFQGGILRHISRQLIPNWLQLTEAVRTGKPTLAVNREEKGGAFFSQFVEDIFAMSYSAAKALADWLQLEDIKPPYRVLDLAAGSGVWSIALSQKSPCVQVTAVDWPEVLPVTRRVTQRFGVGARYHYVEGDLLEADFGEGHQLAIFGHILHSEGERRDRALIQKVFHSLAPGGKAVVAEMLPNEERTGPPQALIFAVNMLVNTDEGDTFTFSEIKSWFEQAGFKDVRKLETPGLYPLIIAEKAA